MRSGTSSLGTSSGGGDARTTPLLFLDIDGVLNRTATAPQINLEQDKVDRLRGVLETSGADVVLSTYWRAFDEYIGYTFGRMVRIRGGGGFSLFTKCSAQLRRFSMFHDC